MIVFCVLGGYAVRGERSVQVEFCGRLIVRGRDRKSERGVRGFSE